MRDNEDHGLKLFDAVWPLLIESKNFVSTAGRLWNVLPADLKCDSNLNMFKFKLKKFILSGAL